MKVKPDAISLYQQEFLNFAISQNVLCFGKFTLKSGRQSPYFFNAGLFNTGNALAQLGRFYAQAICYAGVEFDMLFGPAYKGIPLVATTAIALSDYHQQDIPFCFNRKEVKDHGEGGVIVGAPLQGRVLLIDDVITAGTAIREVVELIQAANAELVGVIIAFDRRERGLTQLSAIEEVQERYGIRVFSVANLNNLIGFLERQPQKREILNTIQAYHKQYGV